jgi:hypothetical protein
VTRGLRLRPARLDDAARLVEVWESAVGRDELDGEGRPFPILRMRFERR